MKNKLLILQGLYASGKTTFAKSLDSDVWFRVNKDDIRNMLGGYMANGGTDAEGEYSIIGSRERFVEDTERNMVINALNQNKNVVVDDMNLNPAVVRMWVDIAREYGADIEFKKFDVSLADALARNKKRENPVRDEWIFRLFRLYEPEQYSEYYSDKRKIAGHNDNMEDVILCDIDGTIALRNGRDPYDYENVGGDTFDPRMKRLLQQFVNNRTMLVFISGREDTGDCRERTINWIRENGFSDFMLLMRGCGDMRSECDVKKELYESFVKPYYNVLAVFDDRDNAVRMWRDEGLLCPQVYYCNF